MDPWNTSRECPMLIETTALRSKSSNLFEHAFFRPAQLQINGSGGFEAGQRLKTVVVDFSFHFPFNRI